MKRLLLATLAVAGIAVGQGKPDSLDLYRIGYTDGYNRGRQEGIEEGYRRAIEDFRRIYQEKLQEYREIEAGKFLIKEQRISYPRVYQISDGRGAQLMVEGCRIVREVDDLLAMIPVRSSEMITERKEEPVELVKDVQPFYRVKVPQEYADRLKNTDALFFKASGQPYYEVYFKDRVSMESFCSINRCEK